MGANEEHLKQSSSLGDVLETSLRKVDHVGLLQNCFSVGN